MESVGQGRGGVVSSGIGPLVEVTSFWLTTSALHICKGEPGILASTTNAKLVSRIVQLWRKDAILTISTVCVMATYSYEEIKILITERVHLIASYSEKVLMGRGLF
jgi:hypothetical protein